MFKEERKEIYPSEKKVVPVEPEKDEKEVMKEVTEAIVEQETTSKTQGEVPEKVIKISRVAKVVKGGKNFSFSAVVVAGDGKGNVGIGLGKSNEVVDAIRKGALQAKKNAVKIKVKGDTIPHEAFGKYKASKVKLMPAGAGTGVIAGGPIRALCDAAGIKNILTKCLGSRNPINVARAAMDGFKKLRFERRK